MKTINTGSFAFAATMFVALSATAGIKYWDNPAYRAFDVDCYVQDGLVLNYDGIRNAGPNADHDPNATTWINCANPGTCDMERYSTNGTKDNSNQATAAAWNKDASKGEWTDYGFVFSKGSIFWESSNFKLPTAFTHQLLVEATSADQSGIGYPVCGYNASLWNNGGSIGIRSSGTIANTMYFTPLDNAGGNSGNRPAISGTSFTYGTAILRDKESVMFSGTTAPWSSASTGGTSGYYSNSSYNPVERTISNGISLGGHYPRTDEMFKGTIKFYRFYSKALSDDEVAWNRVVDEYRYFGRTSALPVTNVVVASNIPIVAGEEPAGCYAVDGSHTFTAPASKVVKGRNYTLDGFTVETWNDATGTWGEPVSHPGESSCAATETSRIRLVWQWTPGDGLIAYDADDYVQDGLVLHYDGIRNAGLAAPHDSAATTWVNLGTAGAAYDMTRYSLVSGAMVSGDATGSWTGDGFAFAKNAFFYESESLTVQPCYTLQTVIEATANDQNGVGYVMAPSKTYNSNDPLRFSIGLRDTSFDYGDATLAYSFYHNALDSTGGRPAVSVALDEKVKYGTAMLDRTNGVFFTGTTPPWDATGASNGHAAKLSGTSSARTYGGLTLGGNYNYATDMFAGTIHDFRFYDRVLSDDEIAWNRVVDEARYFTEPNVVVASTRADVQANEPDGVYEVSGSYTFTAPESVMVGKITYAPAGYAIQQWDDATGCWGAATEYTGASYAYTTAAGKVRLLWRWKAVSGIRTAADYDVSDYVAGGLTFHLDGIRNAGVAEDHDSKATTWVNIGTDGEARNATITKTTDLAWTENGYTFDGTRKFLVSNATGLGTASHTVQFLTDAVQNNQQNPSGATIYFFSGAADWFAGATYSGSYYYRIQGNGNDLKLRFTFDKDEPIGYATLMTDASAKKAYAFQGDTKSDAEPNVKSYDSISAPSFGNLAIGGWGGGESQYMKGTVNYFRYYDRVLSDAELAHNREVDEARYFDALTVTNVVVQTKFASIAGEEEVLAEEPGAYKVEGEWTFSATKVKDKEGVLKDVAGYYTEELNADGTWTRKTWHDGTSYTYRAETLQGKTIRLTWCTNRKGLLVIMR